MKLSSIFEQDPAQAAAMGANALKKTMGANTSGAMISKALGKLDQGSTLSGPLAKALSPYADALEKILSNPMYRNKFMQMMKQIQTADNKAQATSAVQEDWGSSDGTVLVKAIDNAVAARGLSPEVIQDEAEHLAELYYDNMGYDSPEEAVDRIIDTWKLRSSTGRALARMFATDESVQEVANHVDGDADINRVRKLAGLPTTEGMVDIEYGVDPKLQKLVDIGHLLRKTLDVGSGVKWDDADFNKAANLADALISLGATFGPKNLKDALKLADMDIAQAQDLIAKASNRTSESTIAEQEDDTVDTVTLDIPLMIRMLEFAREDAQDDMDLHGVAERMIAMSKDGPLSMDDYENIVGDVEALPAPEETPVEEGYYAPGPETMPGAVGPQETTTVSFNQSKQMGDATLNINASAKDMEELHRILKLAGIDYDSNGDMQEPDMQVVDAEAPAEEPCGCEDEMPTDVKYSTDKQTLINVLRDKLQKRLA